jgi:UDP-3-O-[3-hydroxymyristoyl] glucosamine N-acyltransferase
MPTLAELARLCGATLVGSDGQAVSRVAPLDEAGPGELSLLLDRKHVAAARETRAIALLTTPALRDELARDDLAYLLSPQPRLALVPGLRAFEPAEAAAPGVDPRAFVDPSARVDPSAVVGPFAYVGARAQVGARAVLHPFAHVGAASTVGEGSVLHPGATLYPRCRIGRNVILHAGCVLGSDGFGYVPEGRRLLKVPQVGAVEVHDDAEVGANTTVDRATLGSTRIGRGTKVDNLVQLGHNVSLGEDNAISALTGISGSTSTGRNVTLAGQVGTQAHIHIGDGVVAAGQTGVTKDIPPGTQIAGYSVPHREWLRAESLYRRLPELKKELDGLVARVAALEAARAQAAGATSARARRPKSPPRRKRPSARGRRR